MPDCRHKLTIEQNALLAGYLTFKVTVYAANNDFSTNQAVSQVSQTIGWLDPR